MMLEQQPLLQSSVANIIELDLSGSKLPIEADMLSEVNEVL
jgi:hypothetical protein